MQVTDFRCLPSATLELDARLTLIIGPNASGKTSLLEALYVLGRGRSFRTRRLEHLIRRGRERFVVYGEITADERRVAMGIEGSKEGMRAQVAGQRAASLAELALLFPVQIIDPEIHRLIEEGPSRRRRFLDWGVFHVEPRFVDDWQRFQTTLKQRNAALKARQGEGTIRAWDHDLVRYGERIAEARTRYVGRLGERAGPMIQNLLGQELGLSHRPGWVRELSYAEALQQSWSQDQDTGLTQVGPHRAELAIRLNDLAVKDRISRGQQKLLAAGLALAQMELFPQDSPVRPTLLLDDPAAELDDERLTRLIAEVTGQSVQLVVTALHPGLSQLGAPGARYRIAEGQLTLD
ncbi:MAG TPA: DNA replication/repair protein RecF [Steroidobacteraceae bacterium]|nr:DNA replication/repair protein RecF [Steroidobacteraceae bacterium]